MEHSINIKQLLKNRQLAPKKRFGQNFLVDKQVAARIVDMAGITDQDTVIELGVGFGALTKPLAKKARRVIGLEIDSGIIRWLQEEGQLPDNVTLLHQDILTADFKELARQSEGRLKILANLPYSISNPLLFKLIEHREIMDWAVLMLQKEVGQRLAAKPATKAYGTVTIMMGACASITNLLEVSSARFHPRPKVDSLVLRLIFQPVPERVAALPHYDQELFTKLVRGAFQQRRKTLLNALATADLNLTKPDLEGILGQAVINPKSRGETLSLEDYIRIANIISEKHA